MGTRIEEIFSRKTGRSVEAGEILLLDVGYIMSHDNTTPLAIKAFRGNGKSLLDKSRIVLQFDHAYPTLTARLLSTAMMPDHLGEVESVVPLRSAVEISITECLVAPDLGGPLTTEEMTQQVIHHLQTTTGRNIS